MMNFMIKYLEEKMSNNSNNNEETDRLCPECGELVIEKFDIDVNRLTFKYFVCGDCGYEF